MHRRDSALPASGHSDALGEARRGNGVGYSENERQKGVQYIHRGSITFMESFYAE